MWEPLKPFSGSGGVHAGFGQDMQGGHSRFTRLERETWRQACGIELDDGEIQRKLGEAKLPDREPGEVKGTSKGSGTEWE